MIFQTFALFQILTIYHVHYSQSFTQVQSNKNYPGEVVYSDVGSITDSEFVLVDILWLLTGHLWSSILVMPGLGLLINIIVIYPWITSFYKRWD
jgi:hypothetical protein